MARKLKSSSVESVTDDGAKNVTAQQAVTTPSSSPSPGPAVSDGGVGADAIHKRLRALRKKLQRVEAAENRKASQETAGSVNQELAAPSKAAVLRAVVKELEGLGQLTGGSTAGGGVRTGEDGPRIGYSTPQKKRDIDVNESVQTLRLAYAATDGLAKAGASCISDPERHKLTQFYSMLLAGVGIGAADEKLAPAPAAIAKHLRQLALRETANVAGMEETNYAELSSLVDRVLGYANGGNGEDRVTQLTSDVLNARSAGSQAVIMPALKYMSIRSDGSDAENSDFNGHVVVPPGGISFIASADVVDDTDSEEVAANEVLAVTTAEGLERSIAVEVSAGVVMPLPLDMNGASEAVAKHVGGFAQQFPTDDQVPVAAPEDNGDAADNSQRNGTTTIMPAPGSHPGVNGVTVPPPVGFGGYGAPPTGILPNWAATTAPPGVAAAAAATMPGVPSGFGVMPMLYPPHIAMQYGYLPPHMYNMLGVNTTGAGANPAHSGQMPSANGDASAAVAVEPTAQQAPPSGVGMPGVVHGEMWGADVKNAGMSTAGGDEARLVSHPPAMSAARVLDGVPVPPPMMSMPSSDPYQQAMAMAAAGFTMNPSFMYPHIDASNLSTAATGGSENNDSVNSADTASNRGGSSRPDSMHVQQQQQQMADVGSRGFVQAAQMADVGSRGFVQAAVPEYPPAAQYMWPQPQQQADHSKNMAQGVYNYMYQQPQQPYHHNHQGQGYRQRGSGASSNSGGSGGQHHGQPRERRNNPGYHRQQRWSNNNNGHHYSRQSHGTNTSAQSAGASSHHGNGSNAQESHDNNSNFNSVGNWQ
ncbi:hypothetical protein H4S08_003051 [Coemansia sp. RSA 1365]|nr:hypothetical protein H4S08_003051 [Coemansia sp. RSA 1365]